MAKAFMTSTRGFSTDKLPKIVVGTMVSFWTLFVVYLQGVHGNVYGTRAIV